MFLITSLETSLASGLPFIVTLYSKGFALLVVPRIVPPMGRIPRTFHSVKFRVLFGKTSPSKPSSMPITSQLYFTNADFTTLRITAFRPGQSPPPVNTPIFFMAYQHPFRCSFCCQNINRLCISIRFLEEIKRWLENPKWFRTYKQLILRSLFGR